jgi:hypothetical protein
VILPTIIAALAAVAAALYVARPLLRGADTRAKARPISDTRRELVEERDRALAALKELEFDHRTGKVSDSDYRELVGALRRQAVETLRSLEPSEAPTRSQAGKGARAAVRR